jgi:outer membrane protein TolC
MAPTTSPRALLLSAVILASLAAAVAPLPLSARQAQSLPGPVPGLAPAPAAPEARRLTLEEARQLAANNKALALARLNVEEKQHGVDAAWKDYLPKLIGADYYLHFNQDLGTVLATKSRTLGGANIGPGGIIEIPTITIPSRTISANVVNQDSNLATIMVAQPITKLIAVNAAVQIARADANAAQAQFDKGMRDLLSGVSQAYHGLIGALRIQAALALQIQVLEQIQSAQPSPVLRVVIAEARQGLVQVSGQVEQLRHLLNDLLNLPPCTFLELVDPLPGELPVHCAEDAAQLSVANSPEMCEALQGIAKAQAAQKVARMSFLPDVNVVGGYANQTIADYIQPDIGYVGVTGSWTLFEWGKKKDVLHQVQTLIAEAHQNVLVTQDKVQLEARKAFSSYEEAREGYRLAAEMVQARKELEKVATDKAAGAKAATDKSKTEAASLSAPAKTIAEKAVALSAALQEIADLAALQAKGETSKAELEYMKAEITYRVAHAKLAALICPQ